MEIDCGQFQDSLAIDIKTVGKPLSTSQAKGYLRTYFQGPAQPADKKEWVYGHLFGIDSLIKFLKSIEYHNDNPQTPENEKISAIRIYNAKSQREDDPYASLGILHDVFIVPVKDNGIDYFPGIGGVLAIADAEAETLHILGQSRPCPNQCGSGSLLLVTE